MRAAAAVIVLLAVACGGPGPRSADPDVPAGAHAPINPTVVTGMLAVDGHDRTYRTFVPALAPGELVPLVLVLHDAGGTAESISEASQFDREASAGGFAVAYPESLEGLWNAGFCCGPQQQRQVDDVAFLLALIDRLATDLPVDPQRLYVAGVSNGGVMAYELACTHPDLVTGVASVAGTMLTDRCIPAEPVSALEIHGTDDPLVPYEGGELPDQIATEPTQPIPEVMARWAELDGCDPAPDTTTEGLVRIDTWTGCDGDAVVRLITIEGGGHTWFATEFGEVNGAVDATAEIATFFGLR